MGLTFPATGLKISLGKNQSPYQWQTSLRRIPLDPLMAKNRNPNKRTSMTFFPAISLEVCLDHHMMGVAGTIAGVLNLTPKYKLPDKQRLPLEFLTIPTDQNNMEISERN